MAASKYKFPLRHYEAIYGKKARTIARYAAAGFPLDDEAATRLLIAGQRSAGPGAAAALPGNASQGGAARASSSITSGGTVDLNRAVSRLHEQEEQAHADFLAAKASGDAAATFTTLKRWTLLVEQLRKTAQTSPEVAEANKSSIKLEELQAVLNDVFGKLRQDLETLPSRLAKELLAKDELTIRETLAKEVNEILLNLHSLKYLEAYEEV